MAMYNVKIRETLHLGNKKIVLHKGYGLDNNSPLKRNENVVCYDTSDNVIWKINGDLKYWDDHADSFVGIGLHDNGDLVATSFSGNVYKLNQNTGHASWYKFVK